YFHYWFHPAFGIGEGNLAIWIVVLLLAGLVFYLSDAGISFRRRGMFVVFVLLPFLVIQSTNLIRNEVRMVFPLLAFELMLICYLCFRVTRRFSHWGGYLSCFALMLLGVSWYPLVGNILTMEVFPLKSVCADIASRMDSQDAVLTITTEVSGQTLFAHECQALSARRIEFTTPNFPKHDM